MQWHQPSPFEPLSARSRAPRGTWHRMQSASASGGPLSRDGRSTPTRASASSRAFLAAATSGVSPLSPPWAGLSSVGLRSVQPHAAEAAGAGAGAAGGGAGWS